MSDLSLYLSIVATTLSTASFANGAWRIWRDRPRLQFFVTPVTFTGLPDGRDMTMVQILICNVGYRPVILTRFAGLGRSSAFQMGIHDEPGAAFGRQDQRFPKMLRPGETLKVHPIGIEALRRNIEPPSSPQQHHDPFRYFVLIDSFGKFYPMRVEDILWHLRLSQTRSRLRGLRKGREAILCWLFLKHARKRLSTR
ncbi:MAG TPA: hypothetical protein VJM09_05270 [Sphingobium sp.]|nr:hypothetical protein [Sphingobium sp.]